MTKLPPTTWTVDGRTYEVSLYVDGDRVVGMTEVTAEGGIIVPAKKLLGDHIANGLAKLGVQPCSGCNKRKQLLNRAHRGARRLVGLK